MRALAAALQWARAWGWKEDKLPCGKRDSADKCPLAQATGWLIAGGLASPPDEALERTWYVLPLDVQLFLDLFDYGRYPELVLR